MSLRSIPIMFLLPIDYAVKIDLIALLIDRSEATWDIDLAFPHNRMCMSRHLLADMRILLCSFMLYAVFQTAR